MILERAFFEKESLTVARKLLGKVLVHETSEGTTAGIIVETEAYKGPEDKASHAYCGRRTLRNEVLFGPKARAYVYQIYGMYFCLNVSAGSIQGKPEAVLIRALEPEQGIEIMARRRCSTGEPRTGLTNGPGRLCMALDISREQNGADLCSSQLHIDESSTCSRNQIIQTKRINVDYAEEWKERLWRFYVKGNKFVSKK